MSQLVASPRPDDYEAMLVAQGAFPAQWDFPDQRTQPRGGPATAGDQFTATRDQDGFLRWAKIPPAAAEHADERSAASSRRGILSQAAQRLPWAFLALAVWCETILLTGIGKELVEHFPRWGVPIGLGAACAAGAIGLILILWPCPAIDYLAAEARDGDLEQAHRAWLALAGTVGASRAAALVNGPQRGHWRVRDEDRP